MGRRVALPTGLQPQGSGYGERGDFRPYLLLTLLTLITAGESLSSRFPRLPDAGIKGN